MLLERMFYHCVAIEFVDVLIAYAFMAISPERDVSF